MGCRKSVLNGFRVAVKPNLPKDHSHAQVRVKTFVDTGGVWQPSGRQRHGSARLRLRVS